MTILSISRSIGRAGRYRRDAEGGRQVNHELGAGDETIGAHGAADLPRGSGNDFHAEGVRPLQAETGRQTAAAIRDAEIEAIGSAPEGDRNRSALALRIGIFER